MRTRMNERLSTMDRQRLYFMASDVSVDGQSSNDQFMSVTMRMLSTRPNRNKQGVTEAFIDEIIANPQKYMCTPLYADVKRLKAHDYLNLGHMLDKRTGRFLTNQIGSFKSFEKQEDEFGISLYGEARIPKRDFDICNAVAEMYDLGILNFSFEICYAEEDTVVLEGVKYVDTGDSNALTGMAIVSVPAYPEATALSMVAEDKSDDDSEFEDDLPKETDLVDDSVEEDDDQEEEAKDEGDEEKMEMEAMVQAEETVEVTASATEPEVAETEAIAEAHEPEGEIVAEAEVPAVEAEPVVVAEEQTEEIAIASLTSGDIHRKLVEAWHAGERMWAYLAFLFPEEHIAWFHVDGADEIKFVQVTYEVANNEVHIIGEADVRIELPVRELNRFYAEAKAEEQRKEHELKVAKITSFAQKQNLDLNDEAVKNAIAELNYEAIADLADAQEKAIAETSDADKSEDVVLVASFADMRIASRYGGLI